MFRAVLDRRDLQPLEIAKGIHIATTNGARKIAERLREEMRDAYRASVHKTDYQGGSAYPLWNFIVVSNDPDGNFTVGAKKNQVVGNQYIDEIFYYMDQGTGEFVGGRDDPWAFPLYGARAGESPTGYWVTKGQAPKEFISGTASRYAGGQFQADVNVFVKPDIELALYYPYKIKK
jgi:hypothetical protein